MTIPIYQVDAFAENIFSGNPAAVCPLKFWPDDVLLQKIAMENNLSETAFFVSNGDSFELRWFTPTVEVDLCGHATLATAFVIFQILGYSKNKIHFRSLRSGDLFVTQTSDLLTLNFPTDNIQPIDLSEDLEKCFSDKPIKAYRGKSDILLVFENEKQIVHAIPDLSAISNINSRGIIITSKGSEVDFVSRFFGPSSGVNEDPVTGSAHTTLTPYWSEILQKNKLSAKQLSPRGGYLHCTLHGDRVEISGKCKLYMKGEIYV